MPVPYVAGRYLPSIGLFQLFCLLPISSHVRSPRTDVLTLLVALAPRTDPNLRCGTLRICTVENLMQPGLLFLKVVIISGTTLHPLLPPLSFPPSSLSCLLTALVLLSAHTRRALCSGGVRLIRSILPCQPIHRQAEPSSMSTTRATSTRSPLFSTSGCVH